MSGRAIGGAYVNATVGFHGSGSTNERMGISGGGGVLDEDENKTGAVFRSVAEGGVRAGLRRRERVSLAARVEEGKWRCRRCACSRRTGTAARRAARRGGGAVRGGGSSISGIPSKDQRRQCSLTGLFRASQHSASCLIRVCSTSPTRTPRGLALVWGRGGPSPMGRVWTLERLDPPSRPATDFLP
ncbi:uncharacterized protein CC84DRAFT_609281 [Paraphaeosphaeria sporulosa]|uniref:Uncharacterized protein n=1 Tax=Paraphaeosphaeria sporulosa TaxID=1460663 RepID=A0A177CII3_9PLEO|nr:uncharacterized protein CC84DRAFT_609281 [Paraphaeosphaeria sporulosa]OAG06597.1 hypothetical protein CC84DRAFT_609281 [Paraphaeosphaeria sporulosa]